MNVGESARRFCRRSDIFGESMSNLSLGLSSARMDRQLNYLAPLAGGFEVAFDSLRLYYSQS
jgi:hypothetical protein